MHITDVGIIKDLQSSVGNEGESMQITDVGIIKD